MNNAPKKPSESDGSGERKANAIDLPTARHMLPLVRSIVSDIVTTRKQMAALTREQEFLDQERRHLSWESRHRRYSLTDERNQVEQRYASAVGELTQLGVALIDPEQGRVDFPTRINGRAAAFTWEVGDDGVGYWRYAEEDQRRPIPNDWKPGTALRIRPETAHGGH